MMSLLSYLPLVVLALLLLHGKLKTMALQTNENTSIDQETVTHYDTCITAYFRKGLKPVAKCNKREKPEIQCQ